MTQAGAKLYREPHEPRGSVLSASVSHPMFLRGAWDMVRVLAIVVLVLVLLGLG